MVRTNWDHRTDLGAGPSKTPTATACPWASVARSMRTPSCVCTPRAARTPTKAVFACLDEEVLDDDGDVLVLEDSAGEEVARFAYGAAGE